MHPSPQGRGTGGEGGLARAFGFCLGPFVFGLDLSWVLVGAFRVWLGSFVGLGELAGEK